MTSRGSEHQASRSFSSVATRYLPPGDPVVEYQPSSSVHCNCTKLCFAMTNFLIWRWIDCSDLFNCSASFVVLIGPGRKLPPELLRTLHEATAHIPLKNDRRCKTGYYSVCNVSRLRGDHFREGLTWNRRLTQER